MFHEALFCNVAHNLDKQFSFWQMEDHCSYVLNLSSWENKAWKKNSGLKGIGTHVDLCDTSAVLLPTELPSQLGAGHFCEFIIYP